MQDKAKLASIIELILLQPGVQLAQVESLCMDAIKNGFAAVCLPPLFIKKAAAILKGSKVKAVAAIGFPFGYHAIEAKMAEILLAIVDGADELEIVINYTAVKNADWQYLANEINHLLSVVNKAGKAARFVLEASELTQDEIINCCQLLAPAEVTMVSTSTGFRGEDISLEQLKFIRKQLPASVALKTFRTIVTLAALEELHEIGIQRVGCNNATIELGNLAG